MNNPWLTLPSSPPYIAIDDQQFLQSMECSGLRFDVLPEPFIGNIHTAKVIFLALNPGFEEADSEVNMKKPDFVEENLSSLIHASKYPFYCLDEKFLYSGGYKWWQKRLRTVFECFGNNGKDHVAKKIMCIQYFPYHSRTYRKLRHALPSQQYSFSLVRQGIAERKLIVIMRSAKLWLQAVPELKNYPYIQLKNPRSPYITKNNMTHEGFETIIRALS